MTGASDNSPGAGANASGRREDLGPRDTSGYPGKWTLLAVAAAITTCGVLPVFLLTAQAVLITRDLELSDIELGWLVTVFFSAAALWSVPGGRLAHRIGPRTSAMSATLIAATASVGMALATRSYPLLLSLMVLGGAANATTQIAANALLAENIRSDRQGLAFGIKQSAVPVSTMVGGLAVPVLALTAGWRWSYGAAAAVAILLTFVTKRVVQRGETSPAWLSARVEPPSVPPRPLVTIAVATGLAAAATNALAAFLVVWAVRVGLDEGNAGLLLAAASAVGITARVGAGILADRHPRGSLVVVAAQMALGASGFLLLAASSPTLLVLGAIVAFGIGWSWPGLLILAVVRISPLVAAKSTSVVQLGAFLGGAVGPILFVATAEAVSFEIAWAVAGLGLLLASALVLIGRRQLTRKLRDAERPHPGHA